MKISEVDAVLSKGYMLPPVLVWLLKIGMIASIIGIIVGVACFFVEDYSINDKIVGIIYVVIGFGIFIFLFSYFIIKNYKRKKIIKQCFKDPNFIIATAKCVDISDTIDYSKLLDGSKIQIEFEYNNKLIIRTSEKKRKSVFFNGYEKVYNKYVNKPIKILYSPLYDEVLVFKYNDVL